MWLSAPSYPSLKGVSWWDNLGNSSPICPNMTGCTATFTYYNANTGLPSYYVFYYYIAGQNRAPGQYEVRLLDKNNVIIGTSHFQIVSEVTPTATPTRTPTVTPTRDPDAELQVYLPLMLRQ